MINILFFFTNFPKKIPPFTQLFQKNRKRHKNSPPGNPAYLLLLCLAILLVSCGSEPATDNMAVTVFAAASLTDAFTELAAEFEAANPGVSVVYNFAGSQALRSQIENGAQADVFASANALHMQGVVDAGMADAEAVSSFVTNSLVVIVPLGNPAEITTLADLARPGVKLVLATREVPVGAYSYQALDNLNAHPDLGPGYASEVVGNVVSEESNVRQVATKVALGEADAGLVYRSDVTATLREQVTEIEIPTGYNIVASYPIAPLSNAANPELAQTFVDFVRSVQGQAILMRWGFGAAQS